MTRKERILRMLQGLPDDVAYDRVIYHLDVMKSIEEGLQDVEKGRVVDHDELFDRLLKKDAKNPDRLDAAGGTGPAKGRTVRRRGERTKSGGSASHPPARRGSKA